MHIRKLFVNCVRNEGEKSDRFQELRTQVFKQCAKMVGSSHQTKKTIYKINPDFQNASQRELTIKEMKKTLDKNSTETLR